MADSNKQISIAIIGAGIASLTLARGLLKHKHVSVRIYEARNVVGQHDGSGVGIGPNGQNAFNLVDPELLQCLYRAGGVKNEPSAMLYLATGPDAGKHVLDIHSDPAQRTVRRNRLLDELRKVLPEDMIATGKRLASIKEHSNHLELTFEDGEVVTADAIIGADGVNSIVRQHLYSDKPAEWLPGFNTRIVIPMSEAESIFGKEHCSKPIQTGWIGQGGFCLTDMEDNGESMQVIAGFSPGVPTEEVHGKAWTEVSKEFWTSRLEGWGWVGEKISKVVESQDKVFASCSRRHDETPVYAKGRICLAGDAAGSFAPAMGAGAGQAIEDALVLSTLLGCVNDIDGLEKALQLYRDMRLPRRQWVATQSNQNMLKLVGLMPGVGMDREKLAEAIHEPYQKLYGYDLESAISEAREAME